MLPSTNSFSAQKLTLKILESVEHTGAATTFQASNDLENTKNGWVKLYHNLFHDDGGLLAPVQPCQNVSRLKEKILELLDYIHDNSMSTRMCSPRQARFRLPMKILVKSLQGRVAVASTKKFSRL